MSKPLLGLILGAGLGFLDGLSSLLYPSVSHMIMEIVLWSTVKGLITGIIMGFFALKVRSPLLGVIVGLAVGLGLSYLAAMGGDGAGNYYFLEIMLPGAVLGLIVGFATQRGGRVPQPERAVG